ncbi:MAG: fibronectin type III domain-containing protein [Nitrospirota bacterium]|nr:fibronectin type III domain-containing protein [Nitrospirota bacterium]
MTLTWTANRESDLAGYKVYVGMASDTYSFPGSAFVIGKVTSYTVSNLPKGQTYFFAISA